MKTRFFLSLAVLAFTACSHAASPLLITEQIDSQKVIAALPVTKLDTGKIAPGKLRNRWTIKGNLMGQIEIIGNNPVDADQVAMHCVTYDKSGNAVSPMASSARCHQLFVKLLSSFTKTPEWFAKELIVGALTSKGIESRRLDDLSLETDGEFYFVRRWSRLGK